ncbi:MAG: zinc ABC transporter substrate-binding protein [Paracoccaceae bacterium]
MMIRPFFLTLSLWLALVLAPDGPAMAKVPTVVTDMPVTHALAAKVMGDLGQPILLAGGGADPHSYQLRPSQMQSVTTADLTIWMGPRLTPWLERALAQDRSGAALQLLAAPGTRLQRFGAELPESGPVEASAPDTDPHAWLEPENATLWVGLIAEQLAAIDPEHAAIYADNAARAVTEIAALDASLQQMLEGAGAPIVLGHDAYGYFASHYGLNIAATLSSGEAAEPGAAHLSSLSALLASGDIACIFPEPGPMADRSAQLASGTPTRIGAPLDPEGLSLPPGPDLYLQLMLGLGTAIADCLAGG